MTKIRLTGGEPTLRPDIGQLAGRLGALRGRGLRSLGLTSNGIVLGRQLPALKEAGGSCVLCLHYSCGGNLATCLVMLHREHGSMACGCMGTGACGCEASCWGGSCPLDN